MKRLNNEMKKWQKWLIILSVSIFIGILGEVVYNFPIEKKSDYQYIEVSSVALENASIVEGSKFFLKSGISTLTFSIDKQYVDKLTYEYQCDDDQTVLPEIIIQTYDDDGNTTEEIVYDINNMALRSSTINIRKIVDKIIIKTDMNEEGVKISNIAIDNTKNCSIYRILFFFLCSFYILLFIFIWLKKINISLEGLFVLISLTVGTVTISAMPVQRIGMDEEIHFGRAYFFLESLKGDETISYPSGIGELLDRGDTNWPYHIPESEEELKEQSNYRDRTCDYQNQDASIVWETKENEYRCGLPLYTYVFQWLMIKIGMLLKLPFSIVYNLGRMGSLLVYSIVIYFAIRHLTRGKRILFVLALMPTSMLSAMTYSYDVWVNAFSFLGTSYLLEEWFGKAEKINYKNCAIMISAFVLASLPKAVYIPLLLLAIFIPKEKFRSRKEKYIFMGLVSAAVLMMLSTFVLPTIISPAQVSSDIRGGDTSVGRQLQYIFSNPLNYAELLLCSIKDTFFSYTIGIEGLGRMGHYTTLANETCMTIAICYSVFADCNDDKEQNIYGWQRAMIYGVCFGVICLIWTALYLSFTPVGNNSIAGVQGRYYLPVTVWILWGLRNTKIKSSIEKHKDNIILASMNLVIILPIIYQVIIRLTF